MTRSELISTLASRQPHLSLGDIDLATRSLLAQLTSALADGQRIEVRGFGSFTLRYRHSRLGRNPRTGDPIAVPAKYVAHFKAYKGLRGDEQ